MRQFLGIPLHEGTPDAKTLSNTRRRLPEEVFDEVFQFVLGITAQKKLLAGKTVGVDSTMLEANVAMKSMVRCDTGEDWQQFVVRLMPEEGAIDQQHEPTDEEVRRFDKQRKNKKVSNDDWGSSSDSPVRNPLRNTRASARREQARQSLFEYIEVFYNRQRRHSSLGYKSPHEFEVCLN